MKLNCPHLCKVLTFPKDDLCRSRVCVSGSSLPFTERARLTYSQVGEFPTDGHKLLNQLHSNDWGPQREGLIWEVKSFFLVSSPTHPHALTYSTEKCLGQYYVFLCFLLCKLSIYSSSRPPLRFGVLSSPLPELLMVVTNTCISNKVC